MTLGGLDPAKMAQMQTVSKNIKATIRIDYPASTTTLIYASEDPAALALIPSLMSQFADALATQLSSFFSISGELIEVGKQPE